METEIALKRYINDIRTYRRITPEQEQKMAIIIHGKKFSKKAKLKAREELIAGNLTLVIRIALDIFNQCRFFEEINFTLMDLIQLGNIGLMRAADLYRPGQGSKFVSYAYLSIERHIKNGIKESSFIRIPKRYFKYMKQITELTKQYGELTNEELAKKLHMETETLKVIQRNKRVKFCNQYTSDIDSGEDPMDNYKDPTESVTDTLHSVDLKRYLF